MAASLTWGSGISWRAATADLFIVSTVRHVQRLAISRQHPGADMTMVATHARHVKLALGYCGNHCERPGLWHKLEHV